MVIAEEQAYTRIDGAVALKSFVDKSGRLNDLAFEYADIVNGGYLDREKQELRMTIQYRGSNRMVPLIPITGSDNIEFITQYSNPARGRSIGVYHMDETPCAFGPIR